MNLPRIGLDVTDKTNAATSVDSIMRAESRGVPMVWSTVGGLRPDAMTFFPAALARTNSIKLGTAIVPTYPRHPAALFSQAEAIYQMFPDRFRLGIGPSHRPNIEGAFGLDMGKPLDHLREYLTVMRSLIDTGEAEFSGDYYQINVSGGSPAPMPLYISALRRNAFRLAGEASDGAISWLCPVQYLVETAIPAMREGASIAGRSNPRMIAHVPVVMSDDLQKVRQIAQPVVGRYARLPFYANMFADAGYPVGADSTPTDALLDHLVVNGTPETIHQRLASILETDIDELLVMLIPGEDFASEEETLSGIIAELAS
jgi:alkanesulfonate monooxygenase SsuD/methylene tetrahydromethanopterin reductase-like flavin-dependent oxidoreductase (luciferase family)